MNVLASLIAGEEKVIRRVRTPEGVARYGLPIGSVIRPRSGKLGGGKQRSVKGKRSVSGPYAGVTSLRALGRRRARTKVVRLGDKQRVEPELLREIQNIYEGRFGDFTTELDYERSRLVDNHVFIIGRIKTLDGRTVGDFERELIPNEKTVKNELLALNDEYTGQRFGDLFTRHTEEQLAASGFTRITLFANADVGGYAWARRGYEWNLPGVAARDYMARRLQHLIEGYLTPGHEFFPDAEEVVPLDADDIEALNKMVTTIREEPVSRWPTPAEIASFGEGKYNFTRYTEQGRPFVSWPGKDIMLQLAWDAVKYIGDSPLAKKALLGPDDYMKRVAEHYDEEEEAFIPGDRYRPHEGVSSDYNMHHVELHMPPLESAEEKVLAMFGIEEKLIRRVRAAADEDSLLNLKVLAFRAHGLSTKARGRGWITHPRETRRLHAYWTRGKGLAKWRNSPTPWRTLRRHLAKYVPPRYLNEITTRWFHDVFGYYPGSDLHRVAKGKKPRGSRIGPG